LQFIIMKQNQGFSSFSTLYFFMCQEIPMKFSRLNARFPTERIKDS